MASMHIKRISEHTYAVRQYDEILSVDLGEMNENKLHGHLTVRHLMGHTPDGVFDSLLKVGDEVTVQFRTLL